MEGVSIAPRRLRQICGRTGNRSSKDRDQTVALRDKVANQTSPTLDGQLKYYESEIARYQKEEGELQKKAREYEARQYEALNYRDDQFALSDAALSMSIAMLLAFLRGDWQGA